MYIMKGSTLEYLFKVEYIIYVSIVAATDLDQSFIYLEKIDSNILKNKKKAK